MDEVDIKKLYLTSLENRTKAQTKWQTQQPVLKQLLLNECNKRAQFGYCNCVIDLLDLTRNLLASPFGEVSISNVQDCWAMIKQMMIAAPFVPFANGKQGVKMSAVRLSWQYVLVSWLVQ